MPLDHYYLSSVILIILYIAANSAFAQETDMPQLALTAQSDADCNGIADTGFSVPGSCIIYRVEMQKSNHQALQHITLQANIPVHTQLFKQPEIVAEPTLAQVLVFSITPSRQPDQPGKVTAAIPALTAQPQKIVMTYSVKIE